MPPRGRVKPSKTSSLLSLVVGIVFLIIGFGFAIPSAGAFGVVWTLIALAITLFHAYNLTTEKGLSIYDVNVESDRKSSYSINDLDAELRKLTKLREDGLITDEELKKKRDEIMQRRS